MSIENRGVLIELNISTWSAQKFDKKVTNQVTRQANASSKSGKFTKNLLEGSDIARAIVLHAGQTRNWHVAQTSPWADRGPRYCPTTLFLPNYTDGVKERETHFWELVHVLKADYGDAIETARRNLGVMFDPSDYPSIDEVMGKYAFEVDVDPVPTSGHFAVDMPKEELAKLAAKTEARVDRKVKAVVQDSWDRLFAMCSDMSSKLANGKRFHDSFITNPDTLCDLLTHLNVTKDPLMEAAAQQLRAALAGTDIQDLKEFPEVRKELKDNMDSILRTYNPAAAVPKEIAVPLVVPAVPAEPSPIFVSDW
tara:strand:- start:855 stop:1781 length:927 start_codon:yes stop_codon:yes gene_type:complete